MNNLKTCPCCNGAAELYVRSMYLDTFVQVRCAECKLTTSGTFVNRPLTDPDTGFTIEATRYSREKASEIEAEKWNRRVPCETCSEDKRLSIKVGMILQSSESK